MVLGRWCSKTLSAEEVGGELVGEKELNDHWLRSINERWLNSRAISLQIATPLKKLLVEARGLSSLRVEHIFLKTISYCAKGLHS